MDHFNQLTPAEAERLAILAEECAEVIQVVGKILRHGYESYNPNDADQTTNRDLLTAESGHVLAAMALMKAALDVNEVAVVDARHRKLEKIGRYLHHQPRQHGDGGAPQPKAPYGDSPEAHEDAMIADEAADAMRNLPLVERKREAGQHGEGAAGDGRTL